MDQPIHLRAAGVSVVVDTAGGTAAIRYWGSDLGPDGAAGLAFATERPIAQGALDVEHTVSLIPEHGSGFAGRPGLSGRRLDGSAWAPRFTTGTVESDAHSVRVIGRDGVAELEAITEIELDAHGVLRVRASLRNTGASPYAVDGLTVALPLPAHAAELVSFTGRWCRELHPQRQLWRAGAVLAENRSGRTSHEHLPLLWAGSAGFGESQGDVWGVHLAWSGNNTVLAEVLPDGRRYLQLGELLHPGEVELGPGECYQTPWVFGTFADSGLSAASARLHRWLRARPGHPRTPRPVLLNTWEAVYFDHSHERLWDLADRAAELGIERFVLDDGWFGGRRNDTAGLGDWWVSPNVYPDGLGPLIDHVTALGMEFGLWVEPEMVNPDSELFRAHAEWALITPGYEPVLGRQQLVLNLAHPDAFAHILAALDGLLADHAIGYLKWDMNRNHTQGSGTDGRAGSHHQTLAVYRLLDELRARHPSVEIESCSSGGGRIDYGILERTDRVWTSDCNDALERQLIQRWATTLLVPELMGAHIGPERSHTTGRTHPLSFRAATALFGHLGVEWNLAELGTETAAQLAEVIALHKRFRRLLHSGDVVRFDHPEDAAHAHGVYATDRSEALVCLVQLRTAQPLAPAPLRLPGLPADAEYEVRHVPLPGERFPARRHPGWLATGIHLTGRQLAAVGVQPPVLNPESAFLVHLRRV